MGGGLRKNEGPNDAQHEIQHDQRTAIALSALQILFVRRTGSGSSPGTHLRGHQSRQSRSGQVSRVVHVM